MLEAAAQKSEPSRTLRLTRVTMPGESLPEAIQPPPAAAADPIQRGSGAAFTRKAAMEALAASGASLRAAGIAGVWLHTDGTGWTGSYVLAVAEVDPAIEMVALQGGDRDRPPVAVTRLRPEAKAAVETALAGLDPDGLVLEYRAHSASEPSGEAQAWPARVMMDGIEAKIAALEADLEELRRLDSMDGGASVLQRPAIAGGA